MKRKIFYNIIVSVITFFIFCFIFVLGTIYKYFSVYSADNLDVFTQNFFVSLIYGILIVIAISIVFSIILTHKISTSVLKPINDIDISGPDEKNIHPELVPLAKRINAQNRQIQEQLTRLKDEHENQNRMRREFTANVSHELKTPLTSISGYAEIMRDGFAKPEDISRFSGKIYDETQRLITLVGDIINLSRLDEKEIETEKTDVDLYEVASSTIAILSPVAEKRGIILNLNGTHEVIRGVKPIIEEITYNLCDNAIKYNKDNGSINVTINGNVDNVELSVEDTGIGIPKEELDRVFERFYRVDKSHSKEIGGTGLGLSIVKHGVLYHNGEIKITSEIDKGTKITIKLKKES